MCGIAGFFGRTGFEPPAQVVLGRMVDAIRHRGPDAQEIHAEGAVGLAHARLSIIDLSSGNQPMPNADGSIWVTFNGEIFNFVELREELEKRGCRFRTQSDTETILHAYSEYGEDCLEKFNGDFAFALWDKQRDRLILARDRMGVRPLFYAVQNETLVFASEIKAILEYPGIRAEIDPIALDSCFTFWFPLAPRTPFKGIQELPPAHVMIVQSGRISVKPYWRLQFPDDSKRHDDRRSESEIADELRYLLTDATRIRLRADVPVGAYLSGGLDSSIVAALIKSCSSSRLRTFSVGFESKEFDETAFQQRMVGALGTEHECHSCSSDDIGRWFPEVIRHAERPMLRTAPAPLYRLSRAVRDAGFKVVLTGEGADETLAGYDLFKEAKIRRFWSRQPRSKRRPMLLRRMYPYLPGVQSQPQAYLEAFFRIGLDRTSDPLFSHLPRFNTTSRIKEHFSDPFRHSIRDYDAADELRGQLPSDFSRWHPLSQAQFLETAYLLPGYILASQGDRVAMAHGVEGRFPFLDHRVVEFAAKIPPRLKLKGLTEKSILRNSTRDLLPPEIADRTKQPYRAPDSQSLLGPGAADYADELLSSAAIADTGFFDPRTVGKLVEKCRNSPSVGFRDNMALVGILSVQLLNHLFIRNQGTRRATPASPVLALTGA